jgi:hypothetical protein
MSLKDLLVQHREQIHEKWLEAILRTYPQEGFTFLRSEKDRFSNPVGYTLREEIRVLFESLLDEIPREKAAASLENILKIRAVQDFPPAQAVAFVFLLKDIVREDVGDAPGLYGDLLEFESKIDELALVAFDQYMKCREKIFDVRVHELRQRSMQLLERVNRRRGSPDPLDETPPGGCVQPSEETGDTPWE